MAIALCSQFSWTHLGRKEFGKKYYWSSSLHCQMSQSLCGRDRHIQGHVMPCSPNYQLGLIMSLDSIAIRMFIVFLLIVGFLPIVSLLSSPATLIVSYWSWNFLVHSVGDTNTSLLCGLQTRLLSSWLPSNHFMVNWDKQRCAILVHLNSLFY